MSGNLGATLEDTSWVSLPIHDRECDRHPNTSFLSAKLGRRNYYIGSVILFTACSFMCGQAGNIWVLVAFRFLQGMGGARCCRYRRPSYTSCSRRRKQDLASALFGIGIFVGPTIEPDAGVTLSGTTAGVSLLYQYHRHLVAFITSSLLGEPANEPSVGRSIGSGIRIISRRVGSLQTVLERGRPTTGFLPIILLC